MDSINFSVAAQKAAMLKKQVKLLDGTESAAIQAQIDSAMASVSLDYFAKHDMTDEIARVAVLIDAPQTDIDSHVDKLVEQRKRDKDYKSESSIVRCVLDQAMEKIVAPKLPKESGDLAVISHKVRQAIKSNLPKGFIKQSLTAHTEPGLETEIEKAVEFVKVSMTPGTEVSESIKPYAELIALNQAEAKVKSSEAIAAKFAAGDLDAAEKALAEAEEAAKNAVSKAEADRIVGIKAEIEADIAEIKKRIKNINRNLKKLPETDKTAFNVMLSDLLSGFVVSPVIDAEENIESVHTSTVAA